MKTAKQMTASAKRKRTLFGLGNQKPIQKDGLIQNIESLCFEKECKNCRLAAHIHILGVPHHVTFVRVTEDFDGNQCAEGLDEGANNDYEALCALDPGGPFYTVRVPGFKGEYVCIISPFQK